MFSQWYGLHHDNLCVHITVWKYITLHTRSNDVVKEQSKMLKQDFASLQNMFSSLKVECFSVAFYCGSEEKLRDYADYWHSWTAWTVHFTDSFNSSSNHRRLFNISKENCNSFINHFYSGVTICSFYQRQGESNQKEDITQCGRDGGGGN